MDKKELISDLRDQGFSEKIVKAFEKVDRTKFVSSEIKEYAYKDTSLPIGEGQTISQPSTIAFMLEMLDLKNKQKVLEVGSGSGYVLALLSEIIDGEVYGIEIKKSLYKEAKKKINVPIYLRDGRKGLPEKAPFDRIIVSASSKDVPENLYEQLKMNGVMVIPLKFSIARVKKTKIGMKIKEYPGFSFVPLI